MTPAELADGLDLLSRAIGGDVLEDERAIARDVLREIRGLLKDVRSGAEDVLVGRQVPVFRPSVTLLKLQCAAPPRGLDGIVQWVESLAGARGHRELTPVSFVSEDSTWTKIILPNKAQDAGFQVFERELVQT